MATRIPTLNGEDARDIEFSHIIASHSGRGYSKSFLVEVRPNLSLITYKVVDHGEVALSGEDDFCRACEIYEGIGPRKE
jgi:hypothetical protein